MKNSAPIEFTALSEHSIKRFHERYGFEEITVCASVADRAWRNGKTVDQFTGRMHKKLVGIENRDEGAPVLVKVHAKNCYLFGTDRTLITVYSISRHYDEYVNTLKPYRVREDWDAA